MDEPMEGTAPPAGAKRRLVIKEMYLENFKSYAGVQRVGPFHKSFSSVVGPNGSGKSNVIDAMLFVFGKRAKQLRLNKVSELIHNSTNFQNLEYARVSVHFQEIIDVNDEECQVVEGSEIVITRKAYSDNSSKYYVDDRTSNFTDVTKILKGYGIDLDNNRFLILQGEVEQISMMKPKSLTPHDEGLLEYLEDIIGTNKYVEKIEEGTKQLEEMNEKRGSMVNRVKLVEKEREGLEGAKTEAEEYLSKEAEMMKWKGIMFQLCIKESQAKLDSLTEQKDGILAQLAEEREKMKSHDSELGEMKGKYDAAVKEHDLIQKELDATNKSFKEFERKDIKFREDLKHMKAKAKKLEEKAAKDVKKREAMAADSERYTAEAPELDAKAAKMAKELEKEDAKLEAMKDEVKGEVEKIRVELEAVREELAPWDQQTNEVQSALGVATAEQRLLMEKREAALTKVQEAEAGLKEAQAAAGRLTSEISRMEKEAKEHARAIAKASADEKLAGEEEARLQGILRTARGRLEEQKSAVRGAQSQGAVVAALMAAKKKGAIKGIYGRLGDLGAIAKEYDVAVSTACSALDYIVVDNTEAAQHCVQLLRQNKLGVATFLILDKQRGLVARMEEDDRVKAPEGAPRLMDLVTCKDAKLRVAFYYGLRNTVVAKDLDQASRIAYGADKRFRRVVSVKGELIESSGTMSGGGGKPRSGRMCVGAAPAAGAGSAEGAGDLKAAEADMAKAERDLNAVRTAMADASCALKAAERAAADLETALPKARLEADAAAARAEDLQGRMAGLKAAAEEARGESKREKELEKEVQSLEAQLAKINKSAAGLRTKAAVLQEKMDNAGGEGLKKQKAKVEGLQEGIDGAEKEAQRMRVQVQANAKALARMEKEGAKSEEERTKLAAEMAETKEAFKAIEEHAFAVMEKVKETQGLLDDKAGELKSLLAAYEGKQKSLAGARTVEAELENKAEDASRDAKEEGRRVKAYEKELAAARKAAGEAALLEEGGEVVLPPLATDEELEAHTVSSSNHEITLLEAALADMKPDMSAIAEFRRKEAEYMAKVAELEEVTGQRDAVRRAHDELRKKRLDEFMSGFNTISLKLKEMYQMITLGGDAELELVDSLDPFSEGIVFSVRPPKKSWKNISNLSGGEKTLSSLALVFALHHFKPTPLYVMDEIDAALDFKNVSIVAHYIKERTKDAQFVIISLRNNMFELADRLVGIYKTDNTTKSVTINPGNFSVGANAKAAAAGGGAPKAPLVAAN